ncbi:MAG TPA: hypothetical protein PK819_15005, partial [Thermomicrobiales bacterium]|nr:hypothetical protein [Thermomicrobiales bacterium]
MPDLAVGIPSTSAVEIQFGEVRQSNGSIFATTRSGAAMPDLGISVGSASADKNLSGFAEADRDGTILIVRTRSQPSMTDLTVRPIGETTLKGESAFMDVDRYGTQSGLGRCGGRTKPDLSESVYHSVAAGKADAMAIHARSTSPAANGDSGALVPIPDIHTTLIAHSMIITNEGVEIKGRGSSHRATTIVI